MNNSELDLKSALNAGLRIIGAADNTERQMRDKLKAKGFDREAVDYAVSELERLGYLDEKRYIENAVYYYANRKLYGPRRIPLELRKKGFRSDYISSIDYSEIDFVSCCETLMIKRGFTNGKLDDKTLAFLQRYGYTGSIIRQALIRISGDK